MQDKTLPGRGYPVRRADTYRQPMLRYVDRRLLQSGPVRETNFRPTLPSPPVETVPAASATHSVSMPQAPAVKQGFKEPVEREYKPLVANPKAESFDIIPKPQLSQRPALVSEVKNDAKVAPTETPSVIPAYPGGIANTTSGTLAPSGPQHLPVSGMKGKRYLKQGTMIYVMALVVFAVGVCVSIQGFLVNNQAATQVKAATSVTGRTQREEMPSEAEPAANATATYTVAADVPRLITIPKLQVHTRVLAVGVGLDNELLTPKNIYDSAWYNAGSKPGDPGAQLINGHSSGATRPGVFKNLGRLVPGDVIEIERGDGVKFSYSVRSVEKKRSDQVDMAKLLVPFEQGRPGLNLITCGGKFDPATNRFEDRVIVYAVQN